MWTKFKIKPEFYFSERQHYEVYYECNPDLATKIFKHQSVVYNRYWLCGVDNPIIENVRFYTLVTGEYVCLYNKEYVVKYSKQYFGGAFTDTDSIP